MILIAAIEDNNGMMFNNRRVSQDAVLRGRILNLSRGHKLWMNAYTAGQFEDKSQLSVSEDFLNLAGAGDYCFVENTDYSTYDFEKIIIYRWNRAYPSDGAFVMPSGEWKMAGSAEFAGKSHKKITEEVYVK